MGLWNDKMSSKKKKAEAFNRIAKVMDRLTKEEEKSVMRALHYMPVIYPNSSSPTKEKKE